MPSALQEYKSLKTPEGREAYLLLLRLPVALRKLAGPPPFPELCFFRVEEVEADIAEIEKYNEGAV
jgi:hypothetical protein